MLSSTFVLMRARQPTPVAQARSSRSMMVMDCRLLALAIYEPPSYPEFLNDFGSVRNCDQIVLFRG